MDINGTGFFKFFKGNTMIQKLHPCDTPRICRKKLRNIGTEINMAQEFSKKIQILPKILHIFIIKNFIGIFFLFGGANILQENLAYLQPRSYLCLKIYTKNFFVYCRCDSNNKCE